MKTTLKILFFPILWLTQSCSPLGEPVDANVSKNYYYNKSKSDVIYCVNGHWIAVGNIAMNVDVNSFELLSGGFSKDKNKIYLKAEPINHNPEVDIASFSAEPLSDKNNVYYLEEAYGEVGLEANLKVIPQADPNTYQNLNMSLSKDKNNYFHRYKKIALDYDSFEIVNDHFGKDNEHVYMYDYKSFETINAIPTTFEILEKSNYGYDNEKVYYFYYPNEDMAVLEIPYPPNSKIELYDENYVRIDSNVYYQGKVITEADVKSFKILNYFYAKDASNAYLEGEIIIGADPATFHIPEGDFIPKDKNGSYRYRTKKLEVTQ